MKTRRQFLGAAGVGALAVPLLDAFGRPAFAQPGQAAKRIVFIYSPNGTVKKNFWPDDPADPTSKPILSPLAPHRKEVTLVKGLGYSGFDIPHEMGTMKALTNYDAFKLRPTGKAQREMAGPSLDEALARSVGARSFRPVLRVGKNGGGGGRGQFNFSMEGKAINSIDTPGFAFEYLFGAATGASLAGADGLDAGKLAAWGEVRRSVLDVITRDATSLRARVPGSQRSKMDSALESIRSLEKTLFGPAAGTTVSSAACRNPVPPADMDTARQFARNIAAAFACDLTRVASWKLMPCADVTVLGVNFHNTSHNTGKPEADETLTKIHTLFAYQVAFLVDTLKATPDPSGSGSLMDGTVIYWANECAHGNHDPAPLPIVLMGSAGAFRTGRQVTIDKTESGKYGNLLVSLANAVGDPMTSFGDRRWCSGPLAGLQG